MIKILNPHLLIIICMTFGLNALASDVELNLCQKEAQKYGNGDGKDVISRKCIELFYEEASPQAKKKSKSGSLTVMGHKNMIVLFKTSPIYEQFIISGNSTEITEVKAVQIDEKNKEILAIDGSGKVMIFSSVITGNVAPRRTLRSKDVEEATDIAVLKDEIFILNPKSKEVISLPRKANSDGKKNEKDFKSQPVVTGLRGSMMAVDEENSELYVLSENKSSVYSFKIDDKSAGKPKVLSFSEPVSRIDIDMDTESVVGSKDKKIFKINFKENLQSEKDS